jgi:hypothetical protein
MKWWPGLRLPSLLVPVLCGAAPAAYAALHVVIVEGLGGEPVYAAQFSEQAAAIARASSVLTDAAHLHVLDASAATRASVSALFNTVDASASSDDRLALFLIGHGSYDGAEYKFNIAGPDLTGADLKALLQKFPSLDQLVVVTGSSSGALQEVLKSETRVLITGTRSGSERNVTRFGSELATALSDAAADADKNGSVSAREAFDFAQRNVKAFYEREVRLASEHAVLSGERAARFVMARLSGAGSGAVAPDASQPERDRITNALDALRLRKGELPEDEYNSKLEVLLLELAALDAGTTSNSSGGSGAPP